MSFEKAVDNLNVLDELGKIGIKVSGYGVEELTNQELLFFSLYGHEKAKLMTMGAGIEVAERMAGQMKIVSEEILDRMDENNFDLTESTDEKLKEWKAEIEKTVRGDDF